MFGMLEGMDVLSTKQSKEVNNLSGEPHTGRWHRRVYHGLHDLLYPSMCLFCHAHLPEAGCCPDCLADIHIWPHHHCPRCGGSMPEGMGEGLCGHCLKQPPAQQHTESLYLYHGPVRDAVLAWKLHGRDAAVRWLFDGAVPRLQSLLDVDDMVLPVPMPLERMRISGQHHAANLSRWLADSVGCRWDWRVLRRQGCQPRQSSLSGRARRQNLRKAFVLDSDYMHQQMPNLSIRCVWVVDDILTTGSTLHFAARAAAAMGRPVRVLSLARTKDHG